MTEAEYKPGLEDVPAAKSAVSFLDGKKRYWSIAGFPLRYWRRKARFEETAWLLIKGDLPTQKQLADFDHDLAAEAGHSLPLERPHPVHAADGHPMDAARVGCRGWHVLPLPHRRTTRQKTGTPPAGSSPRCPP